MSADIRHAALTHAIHFLIVECHDTGFPFSLFGQKVHDGQDAQGFSAPGFSHEAEYFTGQLALAVAQLPTGQLLGDLCRGLRTDFGGGVGQQPLHRSAGSGRRP